MEKLSVVYKRDILSNKYLMARRTRVMVYVYLSSAHHSRSKLFWGSLKIAWIVWVSLLANIRGGMLIRKCKRIAGKFYCQPKEEVTGCFVKKPIGIWH